jgi:hypothetical protein
MKKKKTNRGRPVGATTKHTAKGLESLENQLRAHWGLEHSTAGSFSAHQAWIDRHPSAKTLGLRAAARHMSPDALLNQLKQEPLADYTSEAIISAIDARDWQFFEDFAAALRRINADGTIAADDPQAAAFLIYIDMQRQGKPARKFTSAELLDCVDWGKDQHRQTLRPSLTQLRRMIEKFEVPMHHGPKPKE